MAARDCSSRSAAAHSASTWIAAACGPREADATFDAPFSVQLGGKDKNFRIDTPNADPNLHVGVTLASKPMPPGERRFRFLAFGGDNGFDIGRVALSGTLAPDDARVQLTLYDCRLALDGTSFDDFIGSMLPTKQTSVEFTFGVGASSRDGFFHTGDLPFGGPPSTSTTSSAVTRRRTEPGGAPAGNQFPNVPVVATGLQGSGIPLEIPIGKSLGPVRLLKVLLNLDRDTGGPEPKTLIQAALSFSTQIGPVVATIDRVGMKLGAGFPRGPLESQSAFRQSRRWLHPAEGHRPGRRRQERQGRRVPVPRRRQAPVRRRDGAEPVRRHRAEGHRSAGHAAARRQQRLFAARSWSRRRAPSPADRCGSCRWAGV